MYCYIVPIVHCVKTNCCCGAVHVKLHAMTMNIRIQSMLIAIVVIAWAERMAEGCPLGSYLASSERHPLPLLSSPA